ncbi:ChpI protein [Marinihelvus fidelis]|uniref:ChpI protein n=1 Tax=Marinihelvus fidelis TaxID=2613842 RepID=A0A5N0T9X1_9GAMM|nr:ChpI protein [Marinihelvus fidelis]KAA9131528.1 ChpI protein [Marinihelvus fidelis]
MKLAISIPDAVFEAAERLAQERGVPRSQLYAEAMKAYLSQHEGDSVTARLDRVHGDAGHALDASLARAQFNGIDDEAW